MKFEETKKILVEELKPVTRLASPSVLLFRFILISLIYFYLYDLFTHDLSKALFYSQKTHLISLCTILVLTIFITARHALRLSIPGIVTSQKADFFAILILLVWPLTEFFFANPSSISSEETGFVCSASIVLVSIVPSFILFTILSRGYWTNPIRTLYFGSISALSAGAFILEFACPQTAFRHILIWHVGAVFVGALLAVILFVIKRKKRERRVELGVLSPQKS